MEAFAPKAKRSREPRPASPSSDRRAASVSAGDGAGPRRPTMTDVAQIAGVSQSSVSLALNKMPGARLSESTRARVIEAARGIGYE